MKKKVGFFAVALFIIIVINFPIYRLLAFPGYMRNFYSQEQIKQVMYIGTLWDRAAVREVMNLAKEAFSDCGHSEDENYKKYGELSVYASSTDIYPKTVKTKYSLKLWSVHLDDNKGYMWVYYSQEGINKDGEMDYGSWGILSLWKVEKDADGKWMVTDIREHP